MMRLRITTRCQSCNQPMRLVIDVEQWPVKVEITCPRKHIHGYNAENICQEWRREDQPALAL
jgi:hypothetical protein